jgi:response regulator RpfG family c-di-GMP phosphodiesterase
LCLKNGHSPDNSHTLFCPNYNQALSYHDARQTPVSSSQCPEFIAAKQPYRGADIVNYQVTCGSRWNHGHLEVIVVDAEIKPKVLYVDDELANLKALERLFHNEPFEFISFDSPLAALGKIDEIKPAVVISDQRMPEMEGTVFLEKVRNRQPDTVRIIITGHPDLEAAIEAINKGHVFQFIQKPWDDKDLIAQVRSALAHQASSHSLHSMVDCLIDEVIDNEKTQKNMRQLAAAVYCELDQPLMIIAGYIQLLQGLIKDDEIPMRYLSNMAQQIDRIVKLEEKIKSLALTREAHRYLRHKP